MVTWNKIVKDEDSWDWDRVKPSIVIVTWNRIMKDEDSWDWDGVALHGNTDSDLEL